MDLSHADAGAVRCRQRLAGGASALHASSVEWRIGGDQGEGIDATGDVFATVAARLGYHVYTSKFFSSRIKGGHTHYTVRLADVPVRAPAARVDVLVALTQETIVRSLPELGPGAPIIADAAFRSEAPAGGGRLVSVPLTAIAREIGTTLVRNMVAVGASAAVLGLPLSEFARYVEEKFARKGATTVRQNLDALERGHRLAMGEAGPALPPRAPGDRVLLTGNDAVALGALAAGCRLMAAYPITPATDIMETFADLAPKFGGAVCQMEDELAAITAAIGAGYAGARVMTATSGPGLSLMQEGIGLASMAEVPVLIIDVQRAGPSTGMPTKNEQSDLMAAIFGGHGEGERIVIAPATPEEAFADAQLAFNLAERYQCPVILLSDLALGVFQQTVNPGALVSLPADRGQVLAAPDAGFARHHVTDDGISPRTLPGTPLGQYLATGVEHAPSGKVSEDPANRTAQVSKRQRKLLPLQASADALRLEGTVGADIVLVGFGSTSGAIAEAAAALSESVRVGTVQVHQLWPLPAGQLQKALRDARSVLVVEQNSTGELRQLMRVAGLDGQRVHSLLHSDGTLLRPDAIEAAAQRLLAREAV